MIIIISGASSGIGRAASIHMARSGHTVWAGVRSQKSFDDIKKLNVKGLNAVFLDVCIEKSITDCVSLVIKNSGMLHALVNNAGIAVGGPVEAVSMEDWRRQFDTNVFGQIRLTQACLPSLRESRGRIVNISSVSGKVVSPFMGPYSASKFALEAVSDALRRELQSHGVKVSIVEPGPIATPIWEKAKNEGIPRANSYGPQINEVYGHTMEKFRVRLEEVINRAAPVALVTKAIEHALTSKNPRIRYPIGPGIKTGVTLANVIPDAWIDKFIRR